MNTFSADIVAKAFNEHSGGKNWKARPYQSDRKSGVFNAVSFTYKNGMIQILMDCDRPIGEGFQVRFIKTLSHFGDFVAAIQRGLFTILTTLRQADFPTPDLDIASHNELMVAIHKDGAVTYLAIINADGRSVVTDRTGEDFSADMDEDDENSDVDDLL